MGWALRAFPLLTRLKYQLSDGNATNYLSKPAMTWGPVLQSLLHETLGTQQPHNVSTACTSKRPRSSDHTGLFRDPLRTPVNPHSSTICSTDPGLGSEAPHITYPHPGRRPIADKLLLRVMKVQEVKGLPQDHATRVIKGPKLHSFSLPRFTRLEGQWFSPCPG